MKKEPTRQIRTETIKKETISKSCAELATFSPFASPRFFCASLGSEVCLLSRSACASDDTLLL